jgi:hypothetical protein
MDSVGITNKDTQALVNGLINIWNWALALTSAFFVDRLGRRPLFRVSTLGMLTIFTAWTIASAQFAQTGAQAAGTAVLALIFVYQAFYCIAFSPLPVAYSVEVLPFSIRAKGMATYVFATKCAVFVNQYVNVSPFALLCKQPPDPDIFGSQSASRTSDGNTTSSTSSSWSSRASLLMAGSSRPRARLWRRLPSSSMARGRT